MNPAKMYKIEVDQEVYEFLKKSAEPFIDTNPNRVLRRLLPLETGHMFMITVCCLNMILIRIAGQKKIHSPEFPEMELLLLESGTRDLLEAEDFGTEVSTYI